MRACAYIAASGQSSVTPAPPNSWIARSITSVATRAATTLIAAISVRAFFLPTVSIIHAAFIVSSRTCSICMRDSAMRRLHDALVGERLLERDARLRAHAHEIERALGHADGAHAVVDAAGAEAGLRDREAAAFLAEEVLLRDPHVLPQRLAVTAAFGVTEHGQAAHAR